MVLSKIMLAIVVARSIISVYSANWVKSEHDISLLRKKLYYQNIKINNCL